jgi:hypothetical protein
MILTSKDPRLTRPLPAFPNTAVGWPLRLSEFLPNDDAFRLGETSKAMYMMITRRRAWPIPPTTFEIQCPPSYRLAQLLEAHRCRECKECAFPKRCHCGAALCVKHSHHPSGKCVCPSNIWVCAKCDFEHIRISCGSQTSGNTCGCDNLGCFAHKVCDTATHCGVCETTACKGSCGHRLCPCYADYCECGNILCQLCMTKCDECREDKGVTLAELC